MTNLLIIIGMTVLGACLYKWRGVASKYKKYFPRPFNQMAFSLPYALACPTWLGFCVVWVLTTLATITGHGGWMDLGTWVKKRSKERIEFLIYWLKGKIPEYWYDVIGMALSGLIISLPSGVATGNPWIALSGLFKAPGYMLSWKMGWSTSGGEWFTGGLLWGSLAVAYLYG